MNQKGNANLRYLCAILALFALAHAAPGQTPPPATDLSSEDVIARVAPSVAMILTGQGAGRLSGIGTGVIVRPDGVLITAYHVIQNAQEVQVRLKNGEIYDHVQLVGVDERRDVAAIRIPAADLPTLAVAPLDEARPGEAVYIVSNPSGLAWSASAGVLSAVRPVEEVSSSTMSGYRVLQFTAPVSPGSSGGALVDSKGRLLGIVAFSKQGEALNFAIPLEPVLGIANGPEHTALPSGRDLQPPQPERPPSSANLADEKPAEILRNAHTVFVHSRTMWFTPDPLEKELMKQQGFRDSGLAIVRDPKLADLYIEVDRPLWTYTFTVTVTDARTSIIVGNDSVVAASGDLAAPHLAEKIVKMIAASHPAQHAPAPADKP
jgi:S1-C subfamily serine protease